MIQDGKDNKGMDKGGLCNIHGWAVACINDMVVDKDAAFTIGPWLEHQRQKWGKDTTFTVGPWREHHRQEVWE